MWPAASKSKWQAKAATADEALENLKEALELYFEDQEPPQGLEPPIISTIELSA